VRRSQDHDATLSIKTEFMQHWDGLLTDTDVRTASDCVLAEEWTMSLRRRQTAVCEANSAAISGRLPRRWQLKVLLSRVAG